MIVFPRNEGPPQVARQFKKNYFALVSYGDPSFLGRTNYT